MRSRYIPVVLLLAVALLCGGYYLHATGRFDEPGPAFTPSPEPAGGAPVHQRGYRDSGALQDEVGQDDWRPLEPERERESAPGTAESSPPPEGAGETAEPPAATGDEAEPSAQEDLGPMQGVYGAMAPKIREAMADMPPPPEEFAGFMPSALAPWVIQQEKESSFELLQEARELLPKEGASAVFTHAARHFSMLSLLSPEDADLAPAWAESLNRTAAFLPEEERPLLFARAATVAETAGDSPLALTQWGIALLGSAKTAIPEEREKRLAKAEEKLKAALNLAPAYAPAHYAMASLALARGNTGEALRFLERAATGEEAPSRSVLMADPDFAPLREMPRFNEVAQSYADPDPRPIVSQWLAALRADTDPGPEETPEARRLMLWGQSLALAGEEEKEDDRREALLREVDALFTKARENAGKDLLPELYQSWGRALTVYQGEGSETLQWAAAKALEVFNKALEMEPGSQDLPSEILGAYDLLLRYAGPDDQMTLFQERDAMFARIKPGSLTAMARALSLRAFAMEEWAENAADVEETEVRFAEVLALCDDSIRQMTGDNVPTEARLMSLWTRAVMGLTIAPQLSSQTERETLLSESEKYILLFAQEAEENFRYALMKATLCLDMANQLDEDLGRKRRFSLMALDHLAFLESLQRDGQEYRTALGQAFTSLGMTEEDPEKKRALYHLAVANVLRLAAEEPCQSWKWQTLGVTLSRLAQTSPEKSRDALFGLASDVFMQNEELSPGSEAYNLACIAAITGNPDTSRLWLERAAGLKTLPSRAHLDKDSDMDPLRSLPWFKEILEAAE